MFKGLFLLALVGLPGITWAEIGIPPGSSRPMPPLPQPMTLGPQPHHLSAEVCRDCHQEIYAQWKGSMHANSTALSDPIHAAFYQSEVGNPRVEGEKHKASGQYPMCLKCHAPNAARDQKTKLDALPVYNEGVNCLTCHLMKSYKGVLPTEPGGKLKLGIDAYEMGDVLQGPSGKTFSPVAVPDPPPEFGLATPSFHPLPMESNTTLLRTSEICLGCHERRDNPKGVPLCNTGEEFRAAGNFNCQQCHMPVNKGYADHSMGGGHDPAMLERGVIMTMQATREGEEIQAAVKLRNMLPHKMPTGAPFRNLFLKVTAYNALGQPVWTSSQQHPIKDDPQAMFMLRLLDDENKPAPPPQATKLGPDSRLNPGETRELTYRVPAANVAVVRAELYYDLLLPALKERFPAIPAELKKPRVIARAERLM